jgi:hypothetical protein
MAIKTFTTGEVLTAADTNTYLANSGLVFVKSQTIGTAVSSVTVTGAFSTDYDNYKIIISGGVGSVAQALRFNFDGNTADYYSVLIFASTAAAFGTASALGSGSQSFWDQMGYASTSAIAVNMEVIAPFLTKTSTFSSFNVATAVLANSGTAQGFHNSATSFSGFRIVPALGTLTGGTITVYGFRKG